MDTRVTAPKDSAPEDSAPEDSAPEDSAPIPHPDPPIRILVRTLTHLVPGNGNSERRMFILNRICQHHWGCDFEAPERRWSSYNDLFGLNNRRCFFLVDYGESLNGDDDAVPVLSYEWTGKSLKPMPHLAQEPAIQEMLKTDFSFTWKPRPKREPRPVRKNIKYRLYSDDGIPTEELKYIRDHPEDMQWLKENMRPRFWEKFLAVYNSRVF
ncbi:hypothetical protein FQN49_003936 [Arthroderma sp. PD_2]|nr:hypothetical protein FQN49_003936 [Arthroderma sp. PD_2]